jgi:hypothetical protein
MRGILLTRENHIAFFQKEAIHKHIYPKATKSIWEKHISMTYDTIAVYDTKMQTWYDT